MLVCINFSFFALVLSILCINIIPISSLSSLSSLPLLTTYPQITKQALDFINAFQSPRNCTGINYVVVNIGIGGGFAAQFQLAAREWLEAASYHNYTVPVLITGKLVGYSECPQCDHVNRDWTCFFLPQSSCQKELLATGKRISYAYSDFNKSPPSQFQELGAWWWWGIVQAWMFQPQPFVVEHIQRQAQRMNVSFPFGGHVIGVHVRHGDKAVDGHKLHSFDAELKAALTSPECVDPNYEQFWCFDATNRTNKLPVFVASDDANTLLYAAEQGYLVLPPGVSQNTATAGMLTTLMSKHEVAFNATLEIISDIYFLSQCSTLVGICSSQVYRMAVDMSKATNMLRHAVAMDHDQLPRIHKMSARWNLPMPEEFARP